MSKSKTNKFKIISFILAITLIFINGNMKISKGDVQTSADLKYIIINGHKIQDFNPGKTNYNLDLPINTEKEKLSVELEAADNNAIVYVDGNEIINNMALVKISVMAGDRVTKKVYYVNVQIKESYNSNVFKDIKAADFHALALKDDGLLYAWGENNFGQLGEGTTKNQISPIQVKNLVNVVDFDTSNSHSIAVTKDGHVWVWGMNDYGQLKDTTREDILTPIEIAGIDNIVKVRAGNRYSLALDRSGMVWVWGYNPSGQFGDEIKSYSLKPKAIKEFLGIKIKDIDTGDFHNIALSEEGKLYAWGVNEKGQLGDGTVFNKYVPVELSNISNVKKIKANGNCSAAIKEDGTVFYWGESIFSKEQIIKEPKALPNTTEVIDVDIKSNHMGYITKNGKSFSMGMNSYGQLGDGTYSDKISPVEIKYNSGARNISIGLYNTYIINDKGQIYGLGRNDIGQLGLGRITERYNQLQEIKDFDVNVNMVYSNQISGEVKKGTLIKLSTDTLGAKIYYTLDGSEPSEKSTLYTGLIRIDESTKIKAVSIKFGRASGVTEYNYVVRYDGLQEIDVKIGERQGKPDTIVELPVEISKVPKVGIVLIRFAIRFNPEVLEFQGIRSGDVIKDSKDINYTLIAKDKLVLSFYDTSSTLRNINKDGTFVYIKFKVKTDAKEAKYFIERDNYLFETIYDGNYKNVNAHYISGYLNIKNMLYGDVDGDGKVTSLDLQYLQRYVAKKIDKLPGDKALENADINGDSAIDINDINLLKKIILNEEG